MLVTFVPHIWVEPYCARGSERLSTNMYFSSVILSVLSMYFIGLDKKARLENIGFFERPDDADEGHMSSVLILGGTGAIGAHLVNLAR